MNDGQLRRLLTDQSPWRARADWQDDDPDLRAARPLPLDYAPAPLDGIRAPGLYVVRGPRRVGKSLELKRAVGRLLQEGVAPRNVFYCSCDGLSAQDLRRLVAVGHTAVQTLPGPRFWLLDEITAVEGWSAVIKHLRDQNAHFREACVVLTGSSARDLREARKDLADRRGVEDSDRLLLPMGFRGFCGALGTFGETPPTHVRPRDFLTPAAAEAIDALEPWSAMLDDAWQLYLTVGGFPRAVGEFVRDGAIGTTFIDGLWDVVAGDAIRATSMSETDVTAFLAWRCHRIRAHLPNPAAQRKVYFVDPLIAHLPHLRNGALPAPDPSLMSEQQIGLHLARAASTLRSVAFVESDGVMYERTGTGAEIDFVGPELDVPFESKYEDKPWKRATQTMRARHGRGVLVTRTPLSVGEGPVWAVPAGMAAWLLDRP